MADLLTAQERDEIRAAIQDATDTFCTTPCTIRVRVDNANRMGKQSGISFANTVINGLLEFGHLQADETFMNEDGTVIRADIKVTLNLDDMGVANLLTAEFQPIINMATDKIVCHGIEYKMIYCGIDGAIGTAANKDKNLICVIMANREPTLT